MKRYGLAGSVALLLPVLFGASCQSTGGFSSAFGEKKKTQLSEVDELSEEIHSVHVESEIAKERLRDATAALHTIAQLDYQGDPMGAYGVLLQAIDGSEEQASKLRSCVEPMMSHADAFFEKWARSLDSFSSAPMRNRSRTRLMDTHRRYKGIVTAVGPALLLYDEVNLRLRDHATFLANDFNSASIAALTDDVRELQQIATRLDKKLDATMKASRHYLEATAMPRTEEGGATVATVTR